jgi:uncharacterized protein
MLATLRPFRRRGLRTTRPSYYSLLPARLGRGAFLTWLRRVHAWIGLWGAALGILFGVTGILLNHRGDIMSISWAQFEQTTIQMPLPHPRPETPEALATWLGAELGIAKPPRQARAQPARTVVWNGQNVTQPQRWNVSFAAPHAFISGEYWVGNSFVTVRRSDANFWAFLNSLHRAGGMGAGWILLADAVAGSFILLALSGVLLWTRLHGPRLVAATLGLGSLLLGIWFTWQSM